MEPFTRAIVALEEIGSIVPVATEIDCVKYVALEDYWALQRIARNVLANAKPRIETKVTHGVNCRKVPHIFVAWYLHEDNDDAAYDADGVMHCGRCHEVLWDRYK